MRKKGINPVNHTSSNEEFLKKVNEKLVDEVKEYIKTGEEEKLIDTIEFVKAIIKKKKISEQEIVFMGGKKGTKWEVFLKK